MAINNPVSPKKSVKNTINSYSEEKSVMFDFQCFPKWTHTIWDKKFVNTLRNEKDFSKSFYRVISSVLPFVQANIDEILANKIKNNHLIKNNEKKGNMYRDTAAYVIDKIHETDLDKEAEIWQLCDATGGSRLICVILSQTEHIQVFPLFIDYHHQLYPQEKHNQKDLTKKSCKFEPQKRY